MKYVKTFENYSKLYEKVNLTDKNSVKNYIKNLNVEIIGEDDKLLIVLIKDFDTLQKMCNDIVTTDKYTDYGWDEQSFQIFNVYVVFDFTKNANDRQRTFFVGVSGNHEYAHKFWIDATNDGLNDEYINNLFD